MVAARVPGRAAARDRPEPRLHARQQPRAADRARPPPAAAQPGHGRRAPGALDAMLDFLDAHPDVGVVGPQLRFPDGTVQPSRHRFPGRLTAFVDGTVLQRWLGREPPAAPSFYLRDRGDDELQDVDWLRGACLMLRREAARRGRAVRRAVLHVLGGGRPLPPHPRGRLAGRLPAVGAWSSTTRARAASRTRPGATSTSTTAGSATTAKHFGRAWALALRLAVVAHFLFLAGRGGRQAAARPPPGAAPRSGCATCGG